ncbi:Exostosin family protein isoform 2 [Hibiscus syriacus]|uniref:Exostosin family protein isoform 2 n=1 Tax=Hibiscus syriacus TaxID=106335 RepID=A0A6A3BUF3_HIBSY|nr:probable beta-1,4-xylosyltransferase IRX10 [Hibiscus syriacus]KAE8719531.1 Exostosin family protein isoform 2 [Hibiscus syriacus]
MANLSPYHRTKTIWHHHGAHCTNTHQVGALLLIFSTLFVTRLLDHLPSSLHNNGSHSQWPIFNLQDRSPRKLSRFNGGGYLSWPQRGYGSVLSLKIYVYDENEIEALKPLMYGKEGNVDVDICYLGQWGTQVKIHRFLLKSRFRTREKDEADLFFVPAYVKCVHMLEGLTEEEINQTYVEALRQMPYFRRSGGRDHIFVFPSGNGAHFFTSWKTFLNRSIFLTPEGDRTNNKNTSSFDTWKDIIIPGNVDDEMTKNGDALVQPLPLSNRKYLANYLGRAQGLKGRLQLIQLADQYSHKLEAPDLKHDPPGKLFKVEYFEHLRNAKFCLIPRGLSSWTLRFFESFFVECVPVILSDRIELPFQNVIDYTRITIKWPATRIKPQLLEYLESIPDEVIEGMIANGRQVKCLWTYAPESEPCSAMHGILWELQRKVRVFHQSAETFWLHNGIIVNRDLVEFSNWKPPMPLP